MTAHFDRVSSIIHYLSENYQDQPCLEALGTRFNLTPGYLQKLFSEFVGVSPQRFVQQLLLESAKERLRAGDAVLEASLEAGLSGPGRLHDLFVKFEAVTPGEFRRDCAGLLVTHGSFVSMFGRVSLALTERGICWLAFPETWDDAVYNTFQAELAQRMPGATFKRDDATVAEAGATLFGPDRQSQQIFVCGTNFQVQVWRALVAIPEGRLVSYGNLASALGRPRAARAVGTAVGRNPVSLLIPCHRVLRETGVLGGYRWGLRQKRALLAMEFGMRAST